MSVRTSLRAGLNFVALLAVCLSACAGESAPRFKSGYYEQLMIAVDAQGRLTGYFREDQGQGVVKSCAFYLSGKGTGGEIPVSTWSERTFPGTLKAEKDGVRLKIEKGQDHPGCGLVLLPQIAQGLGFDRVADAKWSELRRISSPRAYFHAAPDATKVQKAFVVAGDVVGVVAEKGEWLEVEYRGAKATTKGWIPVNNTAKLVPPER